MSATTLRRGHLFILVVLLSVPMVAGTAAAEVVHDANHEGDLTPATESGVAASVSTINATENVSMWDRASLPFRIDDSDAAKTTPTAAVTVEYTPENTGEISARRTATAVYQPGVVNGSFRSVTGAKTSEFAGDDTQLVIARVNTAASNPTSPLFGSLADVGSLIDPAQTEPTATYTVTDTGTVDTDGRLDTTVPLERPGNYVVFLTTGGNFTASDGDLSIDGSATVIGVDTAVVERERAAVTGTSTRIEPGANATMTVAPAVDGTNVSVILYHEPTWVNSRTAVTVTDRVTSSTDSPNVTIGHSIAEINGHTAVGEPVTVMGTTHGDGRFSQATASEFVDFLTNRDEPATTGPETTVLGDGARLDASVVAARNVSGATTIEVPTRDNWTEGSYRWVVTADSNRTGDLRTATGTLSVASDSGGDGFSDSSGGDSSSGSDDRLELENAAFGSSVTRTADSIEVTLAGTTPGEPVRVTIPISDSQLADQGYVMTGLTTNFTRDVEGEISVSTPDTVAAPPVSTDQQIGYVVVDHSMPNEAVSNASYSFVLSDRRLDEAGLDPEAVALFRFEVDGWHELPTEFTEETRRGYHFVGDSPGLSVYAIAETGSARPQFELNETTINQSTVRTNESIAVNATVTNTGTGPGVFNASIEIGNRSVDNQTVRIPAGEQRTLRFTHQFGATAGEYTVGIANTTVGAVTVRIPEPEPEESTTQSDGTTSSNESVDESTSTNATTESSVTEEPASLNLGGEEGILIGVIAVIVGAGIGLYRRYGGE